MENRVILKILIFLVKGVSGSIFCEKNQVTLLIEIEHNLKMSPNIPKIGVPGEESSTKTRENISKLH
jgi:hypothetical protein